MDEKVEYIAAKIQTEFNQEKELNYLTLDDF